MREFPVIDISSFSSSSPDSKRALARRVDDVCRETGFLAIVGHGVSPSVISDTWNSARQFFDLPMDQKLSVKMPYEGYPYGYAPFQSETLAKSLGEDTPPDLKESFSIGPLHVSAVLEDDPYADFRYAENQWPNEPAGLRQAWSAYYASLGELAARIMKIFAVALDLPEDFFAAKIDDPISAMRALNYPHPSAPPRPGQLRAGAHTDYGSLTILLAESAPGGLEIRGPGGEWQSVPIVPEGFVINIGDLMARWTNDRWVSTLHRVVNPPPDQHGSTRRQSIAFFHQPNWEAEISCIPTCLPPGERPKYPPVQSGVHLMEKFHRTVKTGAAGSSS
ncbi:MAG TPA: 2-oxoglutarate and iron-dependent oxygenase domain-containing protein [Verrucomicrobiae bacterium]|nr:2-oxoglutarate and iron-dependent oxygenase domain-containing protein [Verrucomicrobiae bacterium]